MIVSWSVGFGFQIAQPEATSLIQLSARAPLAYASASVMILRNVFCFLILFGPLSDFLNCVHHSDKDLDKVRVKLLPAASL